MHGLEDCLEVSREQCSEEEAVSGGNESGDDAISRRREEDRARLMGGRGERSTGRRRSARGVLPHAHSL